VPNQTFFHKESLIKETEKQGLGTKGGKKKKKDFLYSEFYVKNKGKKGWKK